MVGGVLLTLFGLDYNIKNIKKQNDSVYNMQQKEGSEWNLSSFC